MCVFNNDNITLIDSKNLNLFTYRVIIVVYARYTYLFYRYYDFVIFFSFLLETTLRARTAFGWHYNTLRV